MGAFDELKEWFSVKDAAAYVSEKIAERIEQKDLLELASEQRLVLHYNLTGQTAAVLPNHGKWALVYEKFSPNYPKSEEKEKDDILYGKYCIVPTDDFVSGLRDYCNNFLSGRHFDFSFVALEKTGQIFMLCTKYRRGVQADAIMSINFSYDRVVIAKHHLDELVASASKKESKKMALATASEYTSPYIEYMLHAISANNITRQNQSKHETLKQWLIDNAPPELRMSENKAKNMATLIRLPESATGGNKKPKKV